MLYYFVCLTKLIMRALFSVDLGLFAQTSRGHWWFGASSDDAESELELTGMLVGLALYNNVLLETRFARSIYVFLLNEVCFQKTEKRKKT